MVLLVWTLFGAVAVAQTPTPEEVNAVARELWCPLCAGVRLDVCELKACEQMREVIAIKLAEGATADEIRAYFVEQYGPQVLGEPPRQGFTLLAWVLPFVVLVAGGAWLAFMARRWSQRRQRSVEAVASSQAEAESSEYLKRLEEELKRLD
ncbi:MAG: hypothetical protein Kow0047_30200 [Anaerolineae bacterium]